MRASEAKARLAKSLRTGERDDGKQAVARFRRRRGEWRPVDMSIDDILRARHHGHRL